MSPAKFSPTYQNANMVEICQEKGQCMHVFMYLLMFLNLESLEFNVQKKAGPVLPLGVSRAFSARDNCCSTSPSVFLSSQPPFFCSHLFLVLSNNRSKGQAGTWEKVSANNMLLAQGLVKAFTHYYIIVYYVVPVTRQCSLPKEAEGKL